MYVNKFSVLHLRNAYTDKHLSQLEEVELNSIVPPPAIEIPRNDRDMGGSK